MAETLGKVVNADPPRDAVNALGFSASFSGLELRW